MAANPRFEISSSSPDSAAFGHSNSHRSHFSSAGSGPNLERASSVRENHDGGGRTVTPGGTGPSFLNTASAAHGDLLPLSQVLALDMISSGEQKYARQLELRRATIAAMAMIGEVHGNLQQKPLEQQGLEELKRIKVSLIDNALRARERSRGLSEAIVKLDKYRASLQLRKRARTEVLAHERPMTSISGERPATVAAAAAANSNKASFCASPSHASIAEGSMPKSEDKNKGIVPNKRVRTSMLDVRLEGRTSMPSFQRSSGLADRDRDSLKSSSSLGGLADEKDRLVSASGEGWEKSKTKGRRSATKLDCVITSAANGAATETERDHKWGAQHRNNTENRPKSSEGHSFRSGPVHGVVSIHKSATRNEPDNTLSVGDKGDRFVFPEKDRPMLKNGVKLLHKDEGPVLNPATVAKAKAARAPRSGIGISVNPTAAQAPRPPSADVLDRAAAAPSRAQILVGPSNRKRPAPTRSSSPPVAQWVGQRPQKMSRVARRMNVAPPVGPTGGGRDEAVPTAEGNSARDSSATPTGLRANPSTSPAASLVKRVASTAALSQIKSKIERVTSPAGLSESDDSEGGDVKSKEKWKKNGDPEGRFAAVNQKMAPLFSPGKKPRVGPKEEGGDGIRRQGRSGRALIAVRESSTVTHVEKGDSLANAKQLRSARPGVEKSEKPVDVKPGRPPTKKGGVVGDRKALTRPRRPATNGGGEVSGESDDDPEELVAAVYAAVNASVAACSSLFWREMEPFFAYLTRDARDSLRIHVKARELEDEEILPSLPTSDSKIEKKTTLDFAAAGKVSYLSNGSTEVNRGTVRTVFNNFKDEHVLDVGKEGLNGGWPVVKELPLSQRLLAALIIEGDLDDDSGQDGSQLELQGYAGDGSFHDLSDIEQAGVEKDQDSESEVETRRGDNGKHNGWVKSSSYDVSYTSNGHRHWDSESELLNSPAKSEVRLEAERHFADINGLNKWDGRYRNLQLDDRIALELQSIGLYPDPADLAMKADDQIAEELKKSHMDLKDQVHMNKERLSSLERVVSSFIATEERERERLAMTKLIEIAFNKRLGCRGGLLGVSGSKSATSKAGRAAALTVAKRSLARWKHFVETGESCFTDAGLRESLLCVSLKDEETKASTNSGEVQVGINSVGLSLMSSLELKLAASAGTRWLCHASVTEKADKDSCESDQVAVGTPSERTGDKDDIWCTRSKEREVLLEDVVGSGSVGSVLCGTKGKRSERERDAGNNKGGGRQGLGTIKGERKTKTKPRQKTAPLLKAVNGLLGKPSEPSENSGMRAKQETTTVGLGSVESQPEGEATLDLTHLQIPCMDDLVVNGDLGGQGQDLGSWLDFDDPGLPDAGGDFMGLDVPMDDLADLAMMM